MSDYLTETPDLSKPYCPRCENPDLFEHLPDGKVWAPQYHQGCHPDVSGEADEMSANRGIAIWNHFDGDGDSNRRIQEIIR